MAQSNTRPDPADIKWDAPAASEIVWDDQTPTRTPWESAKRVAGLTTHAVGPYAAAATAGAAAGAPIGGVGALPGAGAGVLALGLTDLGATAYNLIGRLTGARPIPTGSEIIQNALVRANAAVPPETAGERIYSAGLEGATAAASQAKALQNLGSVLAPSRTQRVVASMGENTPAQAAAGAGAAAAPESVRAVTEEDSWLRGPVPMTFVSLLGGLLAAKGATRTQDFAKRLSPTGKVPSTETLRANADAAYEAVDNAGVKFSPASYDNFLDRLTTTLRNEGYNPNAHTQVTGWVNRMERSRTKGESLTDLDKMRSELRKNLGGKPDPNTRRLAEVMTDEIDDYINTMSPSDIVAGNPAAAMESLNKARAYWTALSKSQRMERLLKNAKLSGGDLNAAIRNEFLAFAKNERKMRGFSPDERAFIEKVAKGKDWIGTLSESGQALKFGRGAPLYGTGAYAAFHTGVDPITAATIGLSAWGTGALLRKGAGGLAAQQADKAAAYMRGYRPTQLPINALISPLAQKAAMEAGNQNTLAEQ